MKCETVYFLVVCRLINNIVSADYWLPKEMLFIQHEGRWSDYIEYTRGLLSYRKTCKWGLFSVNKFLHWLFLSYLYYYKVPIPFLVNLHFTVRMSCIWLIAMSHKNYVCPDTVCVCVCVLGGGGLYDSRKPVLITFSLAFPHIDLVRLHVHMLLCVVTRQLILSLIETFHRKSRIVMRFTINSILPTHPPFTHIYHLRPSGQ